MDFSLECNTTFFRVSSSMKLSGSFCSALAYVGPVVSWNSVRVDAVLNRCEMRLPCCTEHRVGD